jgi:hypothetical protein
MGPKVITATAGDLTATLDKEGVVYLSKPGWPNLGVGIWCADDRAVTFDEDFDLFDLSALAALHAALVKAGAPTAPASELRAAR